MSNVVTLNVPAPAKPEARYGALVDCFASHRRFADDVFWLKENAEVLNILECTGAVLPAADGPWGRPEGSPGADPAPQPPRRLWHGLCFPRGADPGSAPADPPVGRPQETS